MSNELPRPDSSRKTPLDPVPSLWDSPAPGKAPSHRDEEATPLGSAEDGEFIALLRRAASGDAAAEAALYDLVHGDLKRQAQALMRRQARNHTLQATALLHEAWLKIGRRRDVGWESRGHFFAVASRAMRCVLMDHARHKKRVKHGGGRERVPLDDLLLPYENRAGDLLALDEALEVLAREDERVARIVDLKFFGGFTTEEIADALEVAPRTVERDWDFARAWLRRAMKAEP
jgi:RNA polymerase sigma factor (TIGR02999 family)